MPPETSTAAGQRPSGPELERELDRLSLEQAVRDFEIANARVIELTQRLIGLSDEVTSLRERVVSTQEALAVSRRENEAIRASASFRLTQLVSQIRRRRS